MLTLPLKPRRAELRAFATIVAAMVAVVFCLTGLLMAGAAGLAGGIATSIGALLGAWVRPKGFRSIYRSWNRLGAVASKLAGRVISGACYLVVSAAGIAGGRLQWRSPERTAWVARNLQWRPREQEDHGIRGLAAWGVRTGNRWAIALIPYLAVLRIVGSKGQGSLGQDVYTLY
jgi:hypothetical protein